MSEQKSSKVSGGVHYKSFPVPLAAHEDVVKDETLFSNTLRSFLFALGSKFTIPVIGGKELDLHVLYVEVTRRGGYDKVVSEKKWREVSTSFDFSPTTTSASYALRKHYQSLLYHYELVYFFRSNPNQTAGNNDSFQAIGTIDAKFECGYLVSVKVGDETLNGVLYHPSSPSSKKTTPLQSKASTPHALRRTRRRRNEDPNRPKPNRSGYNFFFQERHSMLKSLYPNREREFTKMIGDAWSNLSADERVVYQNYGVKDKERYQKEMKEYREGLKINGMQQ